MKNQQGTILPKFNNLLKYLTAVILSIGVSTFSFASDEKTQVDLPKFDSLQLAFSAFDPSHVLIDESILIKSVIFNLSTKTQWSDWSDNAHPITRTTGLRTFTDQKKGNVDFQYFNIDRYENGSTYGQTLTIPISYQIERGEQNIALKINLPEKAELRKKEMFLLPSPKLRDTRELLEDYGKIFSGATAMKIKLEALAKGEVNTNIRPESILGNFERLLGRYKSGFSDEKVYDLKKYNVFSYLSGKDRVALKVAIFPYKDGSKIVYEAMLPYVIGADGSKEGYELPDKMKFDIEKIVND